MPAVPPQIAVEQGDFGALDRHIAARRHGDPHMRARDGRSVVDAVAGHRNDVP